MQAAGFAGLALRPEAVPAVWTVLLGMGLGGRFALSLIVALDHMRHPAQAGALSALMQGGGFLIAAMPSWIVALLHDWTGGFRTGWILHLVCVAVHGALLAPCPAKLCRRDEPADARADSDAIDRSIPV